MRSRPRLSQLLLRPPRCRSPPLSQPGRARLKVFHSIPDSVCLRREIEELRTRPDGRPIRSSVTWYKGVLCLGAQLEDRHAQPWEKCGFVHGKLLPQVCINVTGSATDGVTGRCCTISITSCCRAMFKYQPHTITFATNPFRSQRLQRLARVYTSGVMCGRNSNPLTMWSFTC